MIGCLILHGYTGGPYEVEPLKSSLQENTDWYIEVPVLPGHGWELHLKNMTYNQWVETAEDCLSEMQAAFDQIYIIGFSMGGMIAAYLAAKYDVDKLVLLSASGKYLDFRQITQNIKDAMEERRRGTLEENKLYQIYDRKRGQIPMKANIEFMKLVKYTRTYLSKINCPVLIAQGEKDGLVPFKTAYYLGEKIPSEQKAIVFFSQSNHFICLGEDKDKVNTVVYDFLNQEEQQPAFA